MRRNQVAVVGAAETTELGVIPNISQIQLHADAALNALADPGPQLADIDGIHTAAAAIEAGLCKTVLITHAESGKSMIGKAPRSIPADSLQGQFEAPFGVYGPPSMFPIPVLPYMKTQGTHPEAIAMVAVVQREWAAKNPRATM